MNAKKAKEVRKAVRMWCAAQKETIPYRLLVVGKVTKKQIEVDGEMVGVEKVTIINSKKSFRGLYRSLKKAARS